MNYFEEILKKVSQEEIMQRYFPEPIVIGKLYISPFRYDKNPTCSFKYIGGSLLFKDFGVTDKHKNCFQVCAETNKCSMSEALRIINYDFNLKLFRPTSFVAKNIKSVTYNHVPIVKEEDFAMELFAELRQFQESDFIYYFQGGITITTIKKFNVRAVEKAWIGDYRWHVFSEQDPIFRYREGDRIKFYRPLAKSKKNKFRNNYNTSVECMHELEYKSNVLFITKSRKDVMCLYEIGYEAISTTSETSFIDEDVLEHLKNSYDRIIVFYDNDEPGVKSCTEFTNLYGLEYFNIPKIYPKDPFDFIKNHSKQELKQIIEQRCFDSI